MKFTIREFNEKFATSDACLDYLMAQRYGKEFACPKCAKDSKFFKVSGRPVYSCMYCRHQVSPLAGTIFHKSSTDLRTWYLAVFLMSTTRMGISAKQLERMTGVTYKCAWRMFKQIRSLMLVNDGNLLTGVVEIDGTYYGGVQKGHMGRRVTPNKTPVMGMLERGGRVRTNVVTGASSPELMPHIQKNVSKSAWIVTDEHRAYDVLPRLGYIRDAVNHSQRYVDGHVHTNGIEGFWSIFKNGVRGTCRHIGKAYIPMYAAEYAWRYSNRKSEAPMFELLLARASR